MLKKNFFTILGFKVVWTSCVFGDLYISSFFGFFIGIIYLFFFLFYQKNRLSVAIIILFFSLIGYSFDSFLSFFAFYTINSQINFLFLPIWFLVLWPCFCCLFVDVLTFLKNRKFISIILGGIFGPLTYYAGFSLGLVSFSSFISLILISFFWALFMFTYSFSGSIFFLDRFKDFSKSS